jgi:hypothetical protein
MSLKSGEVGLTLEYGGPEDGVPNWGAVVNITCPRENYDESEEAVTTPDNGRCDALELTQFVRDRAKISLSLPIKSDGQLYVVEGTGHYYRITRTFAAGAPKVFIAVVRSNKRGVSGDGRPMQDLSFEVQAVA